MFKAFKLLRLEKRPWKFPTSSCLDGLPTNNGNFHRQNGRKEYFLPHFSRNAKWPWKFPTFFVKMKKNMEISNVVVGKSPYFWLSEDSFLLSSRAKSSFLQTTYF